jgi:hypothetical protein
MSLTGSITFALLDFLTVFAFAIIKY